MLELHGARENIRLLETEQTLHQDVIKKLTVQMEAGDVSPFELTQARLILNRTRLALEDARRIAATGEARLATAVGLPLSAIQSVKLDFSAFHRLPEPRNSLRLALTRRADLMALLSEYAAAEAALNLELARQYPDVNLMPGYDYNSGQNRWHLGLNLQLPFNQNRGPIAEAEARRTTAEKRFLAQQASIHGALDIALAAYQASRIKASTAAQLAQEADTASATTKKMVEAGNVSALELTRRQIEASAAKVALMTTTLEAQSRARCLAGGPHRRRLCQRYHRACVCTRVLFAGTRRHVLQAARAFLHSGHHRLACRRPYAHACAELGAAQSEAWHPSGCAALTWLEGPLSRYPSALRP
jgi:outer membrane protein TolC